MEDAIFVRCHLTEGIVRGVLVQDAGPLAEALAPAGGPGDFLVLLDATVIDRDGRMSAREKVLAVSKARVLFIAEDPRARRLSLVKKHLSIEDYEGASTQVRELLGTGDLDAEVYYLAGMAEFGLGQNEQAREHFQKALDDCLDPAFRQIIQRHLGR